ncbi:MAG: lamin tail domain-containing protein, partial [Thermoguttaceae bacterium]
FTGTSIRGNSNYTNRWILVTLSGAESSIPNYSAGDGVWVISPTEVAIMAGHNSALDQGYVAAWTDIDPGTDGEFSVISTHYTGEIVGGMANGNKSYALTAVRLEAVAPQGPLSWLKRTGDSDANSAADFTRTAVGTKGAENNGLAVPFGEIFETTTGLGFSDDQPALQAEIQTDVGQAMQGANASLFARIEFEAGDMSPFEVLTLRIKYDDGFIAYLNGAEIARRGAPDPLDPLLFDSTATTARTDAQAVVFESIDVSDALTSLQQGTNVLAIHGLNFLAGDGDFLILPELIATSDLGEIHYMVDPTPGAPNTGGAIGFVGDTRFSIDRGFYDTPFDVAITTDTLGATIRYTLDGTAPSGTYGMEYNPSEPIHITTTTTLRAIALRPGYEPSNVDTQTYIFLEDVIHQPANPPGFPTGWGPAPNTNYEMDPDVVNDPRYADTIKDDLRSIPTISLVLDLGDLFDPDYGIYSNTGKRGIAWERAASVEMINGDGTSQFQQNVGVRMQGGASRGSGNLKHSFRLLFKGMYGPTKLRYPMFGGEATDRFDTITLRAGFNDRWSNGNATYLQDRWTAQTQNDMGGYGPHGTFVHLYVNGLYWGLYNPVERPAAPFGAAYLGGDKDDYDAYVTRSMTDGNADSWNQLRGLSNDPNTTYADYEAMMDIPNFIDYMMINQYGGNWDWPHNNWYATRSREPGGKWRFHSWDAEGCLRDVNRDKVEPDRNWNNGPGEFYLELREFEEFRELFAQHIHDYYFNGGLLTPEANIARLDRLAITIDRAIVGESARWGDGYQDSGTARTRDDNWIPRLNWLRNSFFQQRGAIVLAQYKEAGLYPDVVAPVFEVNGTYQHGGLIDPNDDLSMTADSSQVFVDTLLVDDTTPLTALVPTDDALADTWQNVVFDDSQWLSGTAGVGYERNSGFENMLGLDLLSTGGDPTKWIDTDGDGINENNTVYIRVPFTLDAGFQWQDYDRFMLRMKYDDGFEVYINGQATIRGGQVPAGQLSWNSSALASDEVTAWRSYDLTGYRNLLQPGDNVLAFHAVNRDFDSSDMLIFPELTLGRELLPDQDQLFYTTDGTDPRAADGSVSPTAVLYNGTFQLASTTALKARHLINGTVWSVLNEATYFLNQPAAAGNLTITEINYNPYAPTADELLVDDMLNNDDFEFIELQNIGADVIDLTDVRFTDGITFTFTGSTPGTLAPGQRVVVAKDPAAFALRYPGVTGVIGGYSGSLDNSGEQLVLTDHAGDPILDFSYNDSSSWPGRADGGGATLEVLNTGRDYDDGKNWRSSTEYGGSPGFQGIGPVTDIVVNEVLTHTDLPEKDAIELHNTTTAEIDVSGWYLSDTNDNYRKFRIPEDTLIPGGGYVFFDEDDFNPSGGVDPGDFALSGAHGDDVWLMKTDLSGRLTYFADHVEFPAAANGEPFGLWPDHTGELVPLIDTTLGHSNADSSPRVGPVIISELHYNPYVVGVDHPSDFEFLEIYNPTAQTIDLTDWRIRGGNDFYFADGTELAARSTLLILKFDPGDAANAVMLNDFLTFYTIDPSVPIVGGYGYNLDNGGGRIQLQRPDESPADEPNYIPHLIEDEVIYDDADPWPTSPDGWGDSLHRLGIHLWGNDPESWTAGVPTPGSVDLALAEVAGRYVFYNDSKFDGNDSAADPRDDAAIAPDKVALLPGQTATSDNYTNYDKGINGIMIDIAGLTDAGALNLSDFQFRVGNSSDPDTWAVAPDPLPISVRPGAGNGGSDRIVIRWADNAIEKQWLQVTVKATAATGLALPDVFYFGNAIADAGDQTVNTIVNATDEIVARNFQHSALDPAMIDDPYDYNRDGLVDGTDQIIARNNQTNPLTMLRLIAPVASKSIAAGKAAEAATALGDLYEFDLQRQASEERTKARRTDKMGLVKLLDLAYASWES